MAISWLSARLQSKKTVLSSSCLSNGVTSFPVTASPSPSPSAKGVIYRVPVEVQTDDLLQALQAQHVKYFQVWSTDTSEFADTGIVLLYLTPEIPAQVRVGYLIFKVRQCIPKPLRCFNCNRFGHVSGPCKGKMRCCNCGGAHKWSDCTVTTSRCPNRRGQHSATSKQCPRYMRSVLHIKTVLKLTYAEACKQVEASGSVAPQNFSSESEFPPLP